MKHLTSKACLVLSILCLLATVVACFAFYSVAGGSNFMLGCLVLVLGGISVRAASQYLTDLEHPHPITK